MPQGVPIYVATQTVDLRYGIERLGGLVREWMGHEPRSAGLYVFIGKRRTGLKLLTSDRTGQILLSKRLDAGVFESPTSLGAGASKLYRTLSEALFTDFFSGAARPRKKATQVTH
jgi:transposase